MFRCPSSMSVVRALLTHVLHTGCRRCAADANVSSVTTSELVQTSSRGDVT